MTDDNTVDVLLFSDDIDTRKAVIDGIGLRPSKDSPSVNWVECATRFGVLEAMKDHEFAALVLDGNAQKEGGMAIAREVEGAYSTVPPIVMITARQQDDWLASWAGAAATVPEPIDPITLQETLSTALAGDL